MFLVHLFTFSSYRKYEKIYFELKHLTIKEIVAKTGCKKSCTYREFREVGTATRIFEYEESHKGLKLWIVGREHVSEVCIIQWFSSFSLRKWWQLLGFDLQGNFFTCWSRWNPRVVSWFFLHEYLGCRIFCAKRAWLDQDKTMDGRGKINIFFNTG